MKLKFFKQLEQKNTCKKSYGKYFLNKFRGDIILNFKTYIY